MNVKEVVKKRKILFVALALYIGAFLYDKDVVATAIQEHLWVYLKEMIQILPAIFIITGLIDVWVSRETIMKAFGKKAGIKGKVVSVLIGSLSAGPIYAAFPITSSLLKKGASLSNVVVMLSAWAVIKVPMLIVESRFLGLDFMGARYVMTVPAIIGIGMLTERFVSREAVLEASESKDRELEESLLEALPGYNCGTCGHGNCGAFAKALLEGDAISRDCKPGGDEVAAKIEDILG